MRPVVQIIPKKLPNNYKIVADFPAYEINRKGVVRNRKTRRVLRVDHSGSGSVRLTRDGKQYEYLIYTLLENTFGRGQF
jgi:hypothetical protein